MNCFSNWNKGSLDFFFFVWIESLGLVKIAVVEIAAVAVAAVVAAVAGLREVILLDDFDITLVALEGGPVGIDAGRFSGCLRATMAGLGIAEGNNNCTFDIGVA